MSYKHPLSPQLRAQKLGLTSSHAESSAFGATTKSVRVCSDADCWIAFGASPVATTSSIYLPAKTPQVFGVTSGQKLSGITTSTGNLYISESDSIQ